MKAFDKLLDIATILNGPDGCPWDHTQTFESLKKYVVEEAYEVIEAVDEKDDALLVEELGDLLYTVVFYAMIAEKTSRFSLEEILDHIREKLIRRHPHIFGEKAAHTADEVIHKWEEIKKSEKPGRKSALDSIPKSLPVLLRAEKVIEKMKKANFTVDPHLLDHITHVEKTLSEKLDQEEHKFRKWELTS